MKNRACNYLNSDETEFYINHVVNETDLTDETTSTYLKVIKHMDECEECFKLMKLEIKGHNFAENICNRLESLTKDKELKLTEDIENIDYSWLLPNADNSLTKLKILLDKVKVITGEMFDDFMFDVEGLEYSVSRGGDSEQQEDMFDEEFSTIHFNVTKLVDPNNIPDVELRLVKEDGNSIVKGLLYKKNNKVFAVFEECSDLGEFKVEVYSKK